MLKDRFGRGIYYLRFSVTERCNFRCLYCTTYKDDAIATEPTLEDIAFVLKGIHSLGFRKVRITGGEPLVRNDIVEIVKTASSTGFEEIVLTTNAYRLKDVAYDLKKANLTRVNISLDSLRNDTFAYITSSGKLEDVVEGIKAALDAGLTPIKINTVLLKGINEDDLISITNLTKDNDVIVRFIELMPVKGNSFFDMHFMSFKEAYSIINKEYHLEKDSDVAHEVARYYKIDGFKGKIGFITAISQHFCSTCNRLRLTSNFKIYPCLFSGMNIDIKDAVKNRDIELLKSKFEDAVSVKPEAHGEIKIGSKEFIENMRELGG
ncbi:MAG: GTP 3',8-cyclase MoaA [Caldisericum sp.]|nr:GTP 3',8-cyclase MoaA [Caldisericum sp.]